MPRILWPALVLLVAAPAMAREGFVTSQDDIPVAYTVLGAGSPSLVFVHGWSCDQGYWRGQADPFAEHHRVVTVDLAGHGKSGLGREGSTMPSFGADVAAVMEELDLQGAILIGHSMGGDVIVEAARQARRRVAGLIWVDTYRSLGSPRTDEEAEAMVAPFRADFVGMARTFVESMFTADADPKLVAWVVDDMSSAPRDVGLSALQNALTFDRHIPPLLAELDLPVIAINGSHRPTDIESLKRHGVEVVIVSDVGHFLMMEDPDRFNAVLADAIASLEGR
jgi:pimeloyl-ACP methyl ester carboxylesterase